MQVVYRLLGPLEAVVDGREARLGGPKQRAMLALLLCQPSTVVPASRLVDGLWREDPPASAANLVQGYVSGLRKALGRDAIETRGGGYVLHVARDALDLQRFERLAHAGSIALEREDPAAAAASLTEALRLWRGPALADLADEPALSAVIARLEELRVLALERRVEAELALGRHVDVVAALERLVSDHPLRERPRGLLMTALYRSERQAEALEAYRAARAMLVDELGIEPSAWLTELHAAILRHDAGLAHPGPVREVARPSRSLLVTALALERLEPLAALAAPLAREASRELLLMMTVATSGELGDASARASEPPRAVWSPRASRRVPRCSRRSPRAWTWHGSRASTTSTFSWSTHRTASSRTRGCSRCSIMRPAMSASWSVASLLARGLSSCRLRVPSTTGPPSSWVPGLLARMQ